MILLPYLSTSHGWQLCPPRETQPTESDQLRPSTMASSTVLLEQPGLWPGSQYPDILKAGLDQIFLEASASHFLEQTWEALKVVVVGSFWRQYREKNLMHDLREAKIEDALELIKVALRDSTANFIEMETPEPAPRSPGSSAGSAQPLPKRCLATRISDMVELLLLRLYAETATNLVSEPR